ncbi:hypothetical protein ScalyP_jg10885 [Parmales sp. scaly parma]|nr:hypothetical protein ScalyP_jg10885 [Parmales sp. scaly parma]
MGWKQTKRKSKALQALEAYNMALCAGGLFFISGIFLGFVAAVYDHRTKDLAISLATCGVVFTIASLRLPIVYHLFVNEPPTAWQSDKSISLVFAICLVGFTFGLALPAEFMLVEIIINDPTELEYHRGGWVCIVVLIIPFLIGVFTCLGEFRTEARERERWARIKKNTVRNVDIDDSDRLLTTEEIKVLLKARE